MGVPNSDISPPPKRGQTDGSGLGVNAVSQLGEDHRRDQLEEPDILPRNKFIILRI
jgi:hypothetical protein